MSKPPQKLNYIPSAESLDLGDLIDSLEYEIDHIPSSNSGSATDHSKFVGKKELSYMNECYTDEYGHEIVFYKDANKGKTSDNIALYGYAAREPVIDIGLKKKPLYVSFSSMEYENEQLLHFLLNKSKNQQ